MPEQTPVSPLYPADGSPTALRGLPLLDAILDHVAANPETWKQGAWAERTACGTTLCVAGHAASAAGWDLLFENGWDGSSGYARTCRRDGVTLAIRDAAEELLGLTDLELGNDDGEVWSAHDVLFEGSNTLADLREIRDEIAVKLGQPTRYAEVTPDA